MRSPRFKSFIKALEQEAERLDGSNAKAAAAVTDNTFLVNRIDMGLACRAPLLANILMHAIVVQVSPKRPGGRNAEGFRRE
jgi:hypothetical protein